jgi:hypothetical protein
LSAFTSGRKINLKNLNREPGFIALRLQLRRHVYKKFTTVSHRLNPALVDSDLASTRCQEIRNKAAALSDDGPGSVSPKSQVYSKRKAYFRKISKENL